MRPEAKESKAKSKHSLRRMLREAGEMEGRRDFIFDDGFGS